MVVAYTWLPTIPLQQTPNEQRTQAKPNLRSVWLGGFQRSMLNLYQLSKRVKVPEWCHRGSWSASPQGKAPFDLRSETCALHEKEVNSTKIPSTVATSGVTLLHTRSTTLCECAICTCDVTEWSGLRPKGAKPKIGTTSGVAVDQNAPELKRQLESPIRGLKEPASYGVKRNF